LPETTMGPSSALSQIILPEELSVTMRCTDHVPRIANAAYRKWASPALCSKLGLGCRRWMVADVPFS
jgi:hypothetical protein